MCILHFKWITTQCRNYHNTPESLNFLYILKTIERFSIESMYIENFWLWPGWKVNQDGTGVQIEVHSMQLTKSAEKTAVRGWIAALSGVMFSLNLKDNKVIA